MRRLILLACLACLCLGTPSALAQRYNQFQIQFVDEFGDPVNMGTSVSLYIYQAGTTTELTSYYDRAGKLAVTQPVTDDSTNTPLQYTTGLLTFWAAAGSYKITATDGTYTRSVDNLTSATARFAWPSYLTAMAGSSYGQSNDIDFTHAGWIIDGDTAGRLDMIPDSDAGIIGIGDATHNADVIFYAAADKLMTFNEGDAELLFTDLDIQLDDDSNLIIGTGNDFVIDSYTAKTLDITPAATDETAIVQIGADTTGVDLKLFAATTADYALWDASDEALEVVGGQVHLDDDSSLQLGSTAGDVTLTFNGTDFLIDASTADEAMKIGDTTTGFDITYYFETAGTIDTDYDGDNMTFSDGMSLVFGTDSDASIMYDETTDDNLEIAVASSGMSITTNDFITTTDNGVANQFKVDATGTVAGNAIVFETTDGGVQINADGASNGDIAIDAADDMTLTAAGDLTLAVTGTLKGGGATLDNIKATTEVVAGTSDTLTAAQSGQMIIYTQTGGACTVTLPEATASEVGVYYWLVDGNAGAGNDLKVDPEGTGTINGDTAGHYIENQTDADGCAVMIVCTAADTWYAVYTPSAWVEE